MATANRLHRRTSTWPVFILIILIGLIGTGTGLFVVRAEPTKETLQSDIDRIEADLKQAEADATKYGGGALLTLIQMRIETLRATKAMLIQKQSSFLRFVSLTYTIEGRTAGPASTEALTMIEAERTATKAEINAKRAEIAGYSGGLIMVMGEMTIATKEAELAFLDLRYVTAKWGIPIYLGGDAVAPKSLGKSGADGDAL